MKKKKECGTLSDIIRDPAKLNKITWSQKLHIAIQLADVCFSFLWLKVINLYLFYVIFQ